MDGKVVVVTGSNSGIGRETAAAMATLGATTVMACRNRQKAEEAAAYVRAASGSDDVHVVPLDLADLASVETAAAELTSRWDRLDVLVNNAGGIWSGRQDTAQGLEFTFGVNHVGPFFLTALLLERLKKADSARIVNVSSFGHHLAFTGMNWNDLQGEKRYNGFGAYAQSKLANVLFTRGLAKRLADTRITANAVHPGPVSTGFGMDGDMTGIMDWGNRQLRRFEISAASGAATSIYLAASPDVEGKTGGYYVRSKPGHLSVRARSDGDADRLWGVTENLITERGFALP
ncbi:MAG TPA: SDR family oxidoreductase [Acidimicrobiales bacterium]|jgi:NAD(P)-dependent dehydrogenase (short-subunit alcohol dehydrogenase family)|nr:SDR family oxidoreductase [Acidimicrobiales bacterium]